MMYYPENFLILKNNFIFAKSDLFFETTPASSLMQKYKRFYTALRAEAAEEDTRSEHTQVTDDQTFTG